MEKRYREFTNVARTAFPLVAAIGLLIETQAGIFPAAECKKTGPRKKKEEKPLKS